MEKKFLSTEMESFTDKHHVITSKFSRTLDYMLRKFGGLNQFLLRKFTRNSILTNMIFACTFPKLLGLQKFASKPWNSLFALGSQISMCNYFHVTYAC